MSELQAISGRIRRALTALYGDRLRGLRLYGSTARGEDDLDSDIDILVLLEGPVNHALEINRIWEAAYDIQLDCDRIISLMPADVSSYEKGEWVLYREVMAEGVSL